ncbi:MAG TPA: uL15m family ribosomal protein [Longimicrobium sp.]|nr:uL15m family ribosomal protein [Longimicrobium sp.]
MEQVKRTVKPSYRTGSLDRAQVKDAFLALKKPGKAKKYAGVTHPRPVLKRGFTPLERTEYQVVNLWQIAMLSGSEVTPETLREHGLIAHANRPVKVLGTGELTRRVDLSAHRVSRTAREKIEALGGTVREIS